MAVPPSPGEINDMLVEFQKGATIADIARTFGRDSATVSKILKKLRPTTALARATILARASEIVDQVLESADVDQKIDILQRANIGVLEPVTKGNSGGGGNLGVFVSVNTASLPAVDTATYVDGVKPQPAETNTLNGEIIRVGKQALGQFSGDVKDA